MPSVIACPACTGQLRLPDEFIAQQVRCPSCSHVFLAGATPAAHPDTPAHPVSPHDSPPSPVVPSLDNGNGHAAEPATKPRGLFGAVELKLSLDEEGANPPARSPESPPPSDRGRRDESEEDLLTCPGCRKRIPRDSRRCYHCDTPLFDSADARRTPAEARCDRADRDRYGSSRYEREPERRDRVPSRGVLILVLGIISLLCLTVFASPLGIILGLLAWIMGHADLNRMKAHEMDPDGGLTKGGWICGIIGTLLNTLITLSCLGGMSVLLLDSSNRSATTYNQPIQYKDATPKDGDWEGQGPMRNRNNKGVQKQFPPPPQPLPPPQPRFNKEKAQEKF